MKNSRPFYNELLRANHLNALLYRKKMLSYLCWESNNGQKESPSRISLWQMEERVTALNDVMHRLIEESEHHYEHIVTCEEMEKKNDRK